MMNNRIVIGILVVLVTLSVILVPYFWLREKGLAQQQREHELWEERQKEGQKALNKTITELRQSQQKGYSIRDFGKLFGEDSLYVVCDHSRYIEIVLEEIKKTRTIKEIIGLPDYDERPGTIFFVILEPSCSLTSP